MDELAWGRLEAAGVPTGAAREVVRFDGEELRAALLAVLDEPRDLEALLAWLSAFAHHWPPSFDRVLGPVGAAARETLLERSFSMNRYLKLRRIATANLARVL